MNWIVALGICGTAVAWAVLHQHDPPLARRLLHEHSVVQWAQVTFWLASVLLGCVLIRSFYTAGHFSGLRLALLLTAFCLFVGMEEINWGYHFFGLSLPEFFEKNSSQQAFSVHNLHVFQPLRSMALSLLSLVMALWAYLSFKRFFVPGSAARLFTFDAATAVLAFLGLVVSFPSPSSLTSEWKLQLNAEIGELVVASVFFCWLHGTVAVTRSWGIKRRVRPH